MIVDIFLKIAQNIPLSQSEMEELSSYISASHVTTAKITNMREIGELAYDLGEMWAGRFIASADPNNNDVASSTFTGTYMDAAGVVGKNNGTVEFQLSSTDGKATAGEGNVRLDSDGVVIALDTADDSAPNRVKWERSLSDAPVGLVYTNVSQVSGNDTITLAVSAQGDTITSRGRVLLKASDRLLQKNPTVELYSDGLTGTVTITADTITFTGTPAGQIVAGTYTPSLTNTTNVAASTARVCQYMRVGSVVTVSGSVNIDPTATGSTVLTMSLPIASNFANTYELGGSGAPDITTPIPVVIRGSSTADAAIFVFNATSTAAQEVYFTFTYRII